MTQILLARTILSMKDPVVDSSGWQFVFECTDAGSDSITAVETACLHFLQLAGTGGVSPVMSYLSPVINSSIGATSIEVYNITGHLNGTPHGPPIAIDHVTLTAPSSSDGLPEGVAAVISFRSAYGTDAEFAPHARPRARDRNRVYIGPLAQNAITPDVTTQRILLSPQVIRDFEAAMFSLSSTHTSGPSTADLRIWSRVDAAVKLPILTCMDNRPDYQRRRSDPAPATRTCRDLASV